MKFIKILENKIGVKSILNMRHIKSGNVENSSSDISLINNILIKSQKQILKKE